VLPRVNVCHGVLYLRYFQNDAQIKPRLDLCVARRPEMRGTVRNVNPMVLYMHLIRTATHVNAS